MDYTFELYTDDGEEDIIKKLNLNKAKDYDNTPRKAEDFYHDAGLKIILDNCVKYLSKYNIDYIFIEYSALASTLENNCLSSFLCLYQSDSENKPIFKSNTPAIFTSIIGRLFEKKKAIYYFRDFFISPVIPKAYLTVFPLKNGNYEESLKDEFKTLCTEINADNFIKQNIENNNGTLTLQSIDDKKLFLRNETIPNINYLKVIKTSEEFSGPKKNILSHQLLLHYLYNELLIDNRDRLSYYLSIPFVGSPFKIDDKECKGQGGCFFYIISNSQIDKNDFITLSREIHHYQDKITNNYLFSINYYSLMILKFHLFC